MCTLQPTMLTQTQERKMLASGIWEKSLGGLVLRPQTILGSQRTYETILGGKLARSGQGLNVDE
jgi:hypothetical protein